MGMKLLYQPMKILVLCVFFATLSLLLNGGFLQLYKLHRDQSILEGQILAGKMQVIDLNNQLKEAKEPSFIERQALDNYDLVNEQDLVFVFADQD